MNEKLSLIINKLKEKNIDFEVYPVRSTNNTNSGDVILKIHDKLIMIEVTRTKISKNSRFKIGQCLVQKVANENKNISQFIVCKSKLFSYEDLKALNFIGVNVLYTDFKKNWPEDILYKIIEKVKSNEISNA